MRALGLRDLIGLLSLAVAVAAAALTWAVGERTRASLRELAESVNPRLLVVSAARQLVGEADARYQALEGNVSLVPGEIGGLRTLPGVEAVAVRGASFFVMGQTTRIVQQTATPNLPQVLGLKLAAGRAVTEEEGQLGLPFAVIGQVTAREYFGRRDPLGGTINTGFGSLRVVGVLDAIPPDLTELKFLDAAVLVPPGADPGDSAGRTAFQQTVFLTYAPGQEGAVRAAVQTYLGGLPVAGLYVVRSGTEWLGAPQVFRQQVAQGLSAATGWTVWLALLAAAANLLNLFTLRVMDRRRELAVRRAAGATRAQVAREVLADQLGLGALGSLAGVALAALAGRLWPGLPDPPAVTLLWALVAGLGLSVLAGLWPLRVATTLPITTALRREGDTPAREGVGLGGLVLGVATLLASFAVSAGSERWVQDLIRERGGQRIVFTTITGPFDQIRSIRPKPPVNEADLAALVDPAIARRAMVGLNSARWVWPELKEQGGKVMLAHPIGDFFSFASRPLVAGRAATRPGEAVVGENLLELAYPEREPESFVGQTLKLRGVDGAARDLRVVGVFKGGIWSHFGDLNGDTIVTPRLSTDPPLSALQRDLHLELREDQPFAPAVARIEAFLTARHPGTFAPAQAAYPAGDLQPVRATLAQAATGYRSTALIMILIGTLGLTNVLLVRVARRQGEIGVRRAVGATRPAVLFQFLRESLGLALLGTALGTGTGAIVTALAARGSPWRPALDWWALPVTLLVALAVAGLAGSLPAYLASRLSPARALHARE